MLMFEPELQTALESVASEAGSAGPVAIVGDFHTVSPPLVRWVFLLHAEGAAKQSFSLLNWSRPIASFSLADMMQSAGTPQSLVIRVEPGSRFDTADYRDNYAWMTDNMVESDFQTRLERTHSIIYDQSITFELWHVSNVYSD